MVAQPPRYAGTGYLLVPVFWRQALNCDLNANDQACYGKTADLWKTGDMFEWLIARNKSDDARICSASLKFLKTCSSRIDIKTVSSPDWWVLSASHTLAGASRFL